MEGMDLDMGTKALHMDLADLEPLPSPTGSVSHALATIWWFNRINRTSCDAAVSISGSTTEIGTSSIGFRTETNAAGPVNCLFNGWLN